MNADVAEKFNVGDTVTWSSQAGGHTKVKTGVIEEVVSPKNYPNRERFPQLFNGSGTGLYRDDVSYVVRVPGKTPKSAGTLYWPRAGALKKA